MAALVCAYEVEWIHHFYTEIREELVNKPTLLYIDNASALHIAVNEIYQSHARSIDILVHHIKDLITKNMIELCKIYRDSNPANIFTKALNPSTHLNCIKLLGMQ